MAVPEDLRQLLREGWVVVGFSTTIMAAGAMTHTTLLQKDERLVSATVVTNGDRILGRTQIQLA